ncbi:hypothetical protein GCM10027577_34790 [Spirosoma fluminis]
MSPNVIITSIRNWLGSWGRTPLALLAVTVAGVLACEEPKEIGLPPTTPVDVSYTDTVTIVRETIRFDSVRSNDQSNLMVGRYADPVFGKVQSRAFVQLLTTSDFVVNDSSTTTATPANRIILDSTRLFLDYNRFAYGDTTQAQELQVYWLTDSLNTRINYDISSSIPAEAQPLVRQTIRPRPNTTDSLSFRLPLPDSYGRDLMALANTDAGKAANSALFRSQFPRGLMLTTTGTDQAAVVGFSQGSAVVVYYHVAGEKTTRVYGFFLAGKRFNQITADRSGTPLAALQRSKSLPAAATNDRLFVQPAAGVTTKLSFPYLKNLVQSGRVAINRADLIITPTKPNNAFLGYPPQLVLAEVDEQNRLRRDATANFLFAVPTSGPSNRLISSFADVQAPLRDERTNTYTFSIGGYLQSVVSGLSPNTGLVITTPGGPLFSPTSSGGLTNTTQQYLTDRIWRLALDGNASVKLVVFYTTSK